MTRSCASACLTSTGASVRHPAQRICPRLGYGAALIFNFATALHSGGLGALLVFSDVPWYPLYVDRAAGVANALEDQQLGGLIMWVPSGVVMMLFALAMFAAWLGEADRRRRKGWSS